MTVKDMNVEYNPPPMMKCMAANLSAIPATTSYRSLSRKHCSGCIGMPKMRAKEKAMEGHIYISSVQERWEKTKFIFDCWKMNGKRWLLHVDPWCLETEAVMAVGRNQKASVLALLDTVDPSLVMGQLWGGETKILAFFPHSKKRNLEAQGSVTWSGSVRAGIVAGCTLQTCLIIYQTGFQTAAKTCSYEPKIHFCRRVSASILLTDALIFW